MITSWFYHGATEALSSAEAELRKNCTLHINFVFIHSTQTVQNKFTLEWLDHFPNETGAPNPSNPSNAETRTALRASWSCREVIDILKTWYIPGSRNVRRGMKGVEERVRAKRIYCTSPRVEPIERENLQYTWPNPFVQTGFVSISLDSVRKSSDLFSFFVTLFYIDY